MVAKIKSKPKNKLWIYKREYFSYRIIVIWPDGKIAKIRTTDDGRTWFGGPCYAKKRVMIKNPMFLSKDRVGKFPTRKAAIKAMNNYDKKNKPIYIGAI